MKAHGQRELDQGDARGRPERQDAARAVAEHIGPTFAGCRSGLPSAHAALGASFGEREQLPAVPYHRRAQLAALDRAAHRSLRS